MLAEDDSPACMIMPAAGGTSIPAIKMAALDKARELYGPAAHLAIVYMGQVIVEDGPAAAERPFNAEVTVRCLNYSEDMLPGAAATAAQLIEQALPAEDADNGAVISVSDFFRGEHVNSTEVRTGQVWADNDPRSAGRTLRVDNIENGKAVCTVLTNIEDTALRLRDMRGRTTRISLSRFRPTATGYRLILDQQYGIRWATGSVFPFSSRQEAETTLREDDRGTGVLVVCDYEPGTPRRTEWRPVTDKDPQ